MLTVDQIVTQIVNQARLLDPTVSLEIGTPERKIVEAIAELIASTQVDFTVLNQQSNLPSLSAGRLDSYLSIFNFGRQQATPSYGQVTFSTNASVTTPINIPLGTQVIANIGDPTFPSLTFVTTQVSAIGVGATSVDVPAQCTVAGSIGDVDANTIVGFASLGTIQGISTVANSQAFTGGTDQEDDATYKARFQNTFLRNISGTDDQFLALAVAVNSVTKASVVGPISRYQEYMQVPNSDDLAQNASYDTAAAQAAATLTGDGTDVADGDTVTVNDRTYRFKDTPSAIGDIFRDASLTTSMQRLVKAINHTGTVGVDYYTGTLGATDVLAGAYNSGAHTIGLTSISYSTAANAYATTETSSHLSFGGSIMSGGVDAIWPHKRTTAESTIPYSKFTYLVNYYLTNGTLDPATATFFKPGVDYVFNAPPIHAYPAPDQVADSGAPFAPNVTFLDINATGLSSGDIVLMEHAYISKNSRNDYTYGILNCVDVFVNGENLQAVNSVEVVPSPSNDLQDSTATAWTYQNDPTVINFQRALDGVSCASGSLMQPMYWQPVSDLPDTIEVGSSTYYKANYWNPGDSTYYFDSTFTIKAHYCMAFEVNSYYGTIRARNGIEWFQSGDNYLNGVLTGDTLTDSGSWSGAKIDAQAGTQFTVEAYLYDQNISDLQATMEANKQTTTDVLVHKARLRYFQPVVTVMYSFGSTQAVVNASIVASLDSFFDNQYYGAAIQMSDILQVIHNVPGVDNVRWSNDDPDTDDNRVQEVSANGYPLASGVVWHTDDFFIQDDELAALADGPVLVVPNGQDGSITDGTTAASVVISVRAQNTWTQ